jgi:NO-binding membrane sensor protein with MHYT domain
VDQQLNYGYAILALVNGALGAYTAVQFLEVLLQRRHRFLASTEGRKGMSHFFRSGMARATLLAAAFSFGVSSVFVLHFTALVAFTFGAIKTQLNLLLTLASMLAILVGATASVFTMASGANGELRSKEVTQARLLAAGSMAELVRVTGERGRMPAGLWEEMVGFLSIRSFFGGLFIALGVGGAHFQGVLALRMDAHIYLNPISLLITVVMAVIVGWLLCFALFRMHGPRRRVIAAGWAAAGIGLLHFFGYAATVYFTHIEPGEINIRSGEGELLVDPRQSVLVVTVGTAIARFLLMGVVGSV